MVRPIIIDKNPVELKYPFMTTWNYCAGSCNVLRSKKCVPKETKTYTLKHLILHQTNMKRRQWQNKFHVIVNTDSIVQQIIRLKNGMMKHVNVNVKFIITVKKIIVGILAYLFVICENSKYLKRVADT